MFSILFRAFRKIYFLASGKILRVQARVRLRGNGVHFDNTLICNGLPIVDVHRSGKLVLGRGCSINSNIRYNPIGRYSPCFFIVRENACLTIGDNTGISSTAIVCHREITIGSNVKIGGNVVIYDTDFHSLDRSKRADKLLDKMNIVSKPVNIGSNVFIGAHSTVLKGVSIGENSIIGACSVVTKDIPADEIWAGNPARFIKKIN